jgi:hypothetical protein
VQKPGPFNANRAAGAKSPADKRCTARRVSRFLFVHRVSVRRQKVIDLFCLLVVLGALVATPSIAWCPDPPLSLEQEFGQSRFVVVGRVIAESAVDRGPEGVGGTNYVVAVTEILRGRPPKKITIFSENSSGRFPMVRGATYVLFVTKQTVEAFPKPVYTVDNCGHSGQLPASAKTLDEARRLAKRAAA